MIAGLGNPGSKYFETKHNVGFMVVDELAHEHGAVFKFEKMFQADVASYFEGTQKVYLVKPTTFMNESGKAIGALATYFNVDLENLLIIHDDLDMPVGKIRFRQKGSSGGQNGIKSIIAHLNTQNFQRLKIGIGRPTGKMSVVNHVLSKFPDDQQTEIQILLKTSADALTEWIKGKSFIDIMNKYN